MRFIAGYRWWAHQGVNPAYGGDIMVEIVGKGKGFFVACWAWLVGRDPGAAATASVSLSK